MYTKITKTDTIHSILKNRKFISNAESLTPGSHLSSLTSLFDHSDDDAERRNLVDGEISGQDEGTNTFTKTMRTY